MFKRLLSLLSMRRWFRRPFALAPGIDLTRIGEFRGEAFPAVGEPNWLDAPDALARIETRAAAGEISAEAAAACRFWVENGYWIVPDLLPGNVLDAAWTAYEAALADGRFGDVVSVSPDRPLADRKLDPHLLVDEIRAVQQHAALIRWTDLFLGRKTRPFQTIIGHAGSQQAAHSDSIHMTTYPLGFMVASWTAFEDIDADGGPLEYYPGSHRLPYLLSREVGIAPLEFKRQGYRVYQQQYEPAILDICRSRGLEPRIYTPNKGGTLFWHANLVHGGTPRRDPNRSRKALVCHYFAEGVVCYHDLSGNLTRLHDRYGR